MKFSSAEDSHVQIREVFNEIELVSPAGDVFTICMRDGGFEFVYGGIVYGATGGKLSILKL